MAYTLTEFITHLKYMIGDSQTTGNKWSTQEYTEAIQNAVRASRPYFFYILKDETLLAQDATAQDITLPTIFGSLNGNGMLTGVQQQNIYPDASTSEWFDLDEGIEVDSLLSVENPTPKIHLTSPESLWGFNLRLWGVKYFNVPTTGTDTLEGEEVPGYYEWLEWKSRFYLHGMKEVGNDQDRFNHGRRGILANEQVKAIQRQHGLAMPHLMLFQR